MNNKDYWQKYYSTNYKPTSKSGFAEFVMPYLKKANNLLELGCGNGRDCIYFSSNGIKCVGVDQISEEIDFLNRNFSNNNLKFVCDDFTDIKEKTLLDTHFDYIYSRFTFHSIDEKNEDKTLKWISQYLNDGMLFVEARSINDAMYLEGKRISENENFTNHYRRYITLDTFIQKLKSLGFEILYKKEDNNLAKYKNDNPYVIRVIAAK